MCLDRAGPRVSCTGSTTGTPSWKPASDMGRNDVEREINRQESTAFYAAALSAASFLDAAGPERHFDADADAAWRAYGADLPLVARIDLALRNLAALYPAAFAPGPVFALPGWYDDDPWGSGFIRPPRDELEALFRNRAPLSSSAEVLARARSSWNLAVAHDPLGARLTSKLQVMACGAKAVAGVVDAMTNAVGVEVKSQLLMLGDEPGLRHLIGIACALGRQQRVPRFVASKDDVAVVAEQARRESWPVPTVLVISGDADPQAAALSRALGARWGAQTLEVGA
jgi:hypothetical protein